MTDIQREKLRQQADEIQDHMQQPGFKKTLLAHKQSILQKLMQIQEALRRK
jgi:hypothetical protein